MKFAISYSTPYYGADPDRILGYAQHAEECGFEAVYLPEHIVLYPGAMVGSVELPPSLPCADPLDCLSFIAAGTSRILLGTGVLLLPYHHPVVLAKRLATIDVLSKGRMRQYTRWGSIDMTPERVEAYAAHGVTRIVVGATAADPDTQRAQMTAFSQRFGLHDRVSG